MHSDDDLRSRFRALASAESATTPEFSPGRRPASHGNESRWGRRFAMLGASAAAAAIALTFGLIWGTNTGYASARMEGARQRDAMVAATAEVKNQLSALRIGLRRLRADLTLRADSGDAAAKASLILVESELRSMESSAERIEFDLVSRRANAGALPPVQLTGFPVARALAITCALNRPAPATVSIQQGIPVVDLPAGTTKTAETFGGILGIRQTSDGNVLVNDAVRRQLKLLDTTLAASTVVMDSTQGSSSSYGQFALPLIPYLGDSVLIGDRPTQTMRVLDSRGRMARSLALPRRPDFNAVNASPSGIDADGRLVYRAARTMPGLHTPFSSQAMGLADSISILRADLDFRSIDTIGKIARPVMKLNTQPASDGRYASLWAVDPLQFVDEWAVLSNGAVAIVRGHDYHIDWIQPGGTSLETPKLPFDWKRLSDDDKQRLSDSVRTAQNALLAGGYPQAEYGIRTPCSQAVQTMAQSGGGGGRAGRDGNVPATPIDLTGCIDIVQTSAIPRVGGLSAISVPGLSPLADLLRAGPIADYLPPIGINSTLADRDGNLWILPRISTLSKNGELVYDVVNSTGKLFQRVRLPVGRSIAGFGPGGVVYLQSGDRTNGFHLERTRLGAPKS